jgi:hypothetical protein
MHDKGNTFLIALVIGGIVFAGLGLFVFTQRSSQPVNTNNLQANPRDEVTTIVEKSEEGVMETVEFEQDGTTLVANLLDVSGGNGTGKGYVKRTDGKLVHSVVANLPDPTGNNFYEGWLVQQTPLKFFSTGNMFLGNDGNYILEYESSELFESYNFVVITLETKKDTTPEKHILEGLAQ